ncbi:hypothetical protein [Paraglaciecola chathamensis]|uniref:Uncharacterized protein n=1 Tax=Paraglaciecola chathamensis S18K6 TaxID=1127672 RepID=A0AAV3UUW3_9ALTE|nr:hypothetical protein [Paraglaciecola chathamensis]GAC08700.1 hypothetical protein GCHA_0737 [Paraglaciecola chathamensis S18K6]
MKRILFAVAIPALFSSFSVHANATAVPKIKGADRPPFKREIKMEADDKKGVQKDQNEQVVIRKGRTALNKKPPFTQRTTHARVQLSEETSRKRGPRPPFKR